jgi:hypothetical protein
VWNLFSRLALFFDYKALSKSIVGGGRYTWIKDGGFRRLRLRARSAFFKNTIQMEKGAEAATYTLLMTSE